MPRNRLRRTPTRLQRPSDNSAQAQDGTTPSTPEAQDAGKPADSSDAQKANDEWKQKIAEQQAKVDLLTRELDVTQREYRLRAAAFYADAGNRLRDPGAWDKEDAQYKQQIAQKQKGPGRCQEGRGRSEGTGAQGRSAGQVAAVARTVLIHESLRFRPEAFSP